MGRITTDTRSHTMNTRTSALIGGHQGRLPRDRDRWYAPGRLTRRVLAWLELQHQRNRQAELLARLDDRLLEDAGLQRDHVTQYAREPFWRL